MKLYSFHDKMYMWFLFMLRRFKPHRYIGKPGKLRSVHAKISRSISSISEMVLISDGVGNLGENR